MSKPMDIFTPDDVNIEHFDGCPAFIEMAGAGFMKTFHASAIPTSRAVAAFFRRQQGDYITLVSDQKRVGSAIVEMFMTDEKSIFDLYERWLMRFGELQSRFASSFDDDLTRLNDKDLIDWASNLIDFYKNIVMMPGFTDGYMFYADKRFDELVKNYCAEHGIAEYQKIFATLSAAVAPSFLNEEEHEAREVKKSLTHALVQAHLKKYAWIKSSYVGYVPYTTEMFANELMNMGTQNESAPADFAKIKAEKDALFEKYHFTEEIRAITRLTELFVKWQDLRKVYTLSFVTLWHKVLTEVGRRANIPGELMLYAATAEIPRLLSGELRPGVLLERQKGCLVVFRNDETVEFVSGPSVITFFEQLTHAEHADVTEVKGMVASVGKVRGPARVVVTMQHIDRVMDGDILIAPMTRPEYIVGMKKAAAIVTDDGGITCHAAIVSRELMKPCIIGTKFATKIFKDGDIVEVDAEQGVVRLIK